MNKRDFLKLVFRDFPVFSMVYASGFSTRGYANTEDDDEENEEGGGKTGKKSVIVVGAGVSGLAAARELKAKGYAVTVLESQSKIGGRTRTDRSLGVAFDEGASWIHGPEGNPITQLAKEGGLQTFLTDDDSVELYDIDGSLYADSVVESMGEDYEEALEAVLNGGSVQESFKSVFERLYPGRMNDRKWKYLLSSYLEFAMGGDISKLASGTFNDDEQFDGEDIIITNGFDKLADYLGKGLNIKTEAKVSKIDYSGDGVVVAAGGQDYEADFAIVTVPLGVLKKNVIQFSPGLPESKSSAIKKAHMGNVNKFLLVFEGAFWDKSLQYIGITPEEKGKFNYFLNVEKFANVPALMTFAFGDYAYETEKMSDDAIKTEILKNLEALYGKDVKKPVGFLRTKWGQNEHSYGAYSFAGVGGGSEVFDQLAEEVDDKIFFAGEHTSREYRGSVHGAYLSGLEAAKAIQSLKG